MTRAATNPTLGGRFLAFLFISVIGCAALLAGLMLGMEPRMVIDRSADGTFQVRAWSVFAGQDLFTKQAEGVKDAVVANELQSGRRYSASETKRRRRQEHVAFTGKDGAKVGWDDAGDYGVLATFMSGKEPTLALADPPPLWSRVASWLCLAFGGLTLVGAVQSSFFPTTKKSNREA